MFKIYNSNISSFQKSKYTLKRSSVSRHKDESSKESPSSVSVEIPRKLLVPKSIRQDYSGVFVEAQRGGLCRMHSINNYFGKAVLSENSFDKLCEFYDDFMKTRYSIDTNCKEFDTSYSDHLNVVSYYLLQNNIYCRYIPLGIVHTNGTKFINTDVDNFDEEKGLFMFDEKHIWIVRKINGRWCKVDSIGGISTCMDPRNELKTNRGIGMMIPIQNIQLEFYKTKELIVKFLHASRAIDGDITPEKILSLLERLDKNKEILSDLEYLIGITIKLFEMTKSYPELVDAYNDFVIKFFNNPNDSENIFNSVPDIIIMILEESKV